jgi:hypothetical protein
LTIQLPTAGRTVSAFLDRFGKRGEVAMPTGLADTGDVVGPKDMQWLKYYLRSPLFSRNRPAADRRVLGLVPIFYYY